MCDESGEGDEAEEAAVDNPVPGLLPQIVFRLRIDPGRPTRDARPIDQ
jgi:hypothetical protein